MRKVAKPRVRRPGHPKSKAAGRRMALEAQAREDLLVAANAALAELRRLHAWTAAATDRGMRVRPGAYLGLRDALHALDALDEA